MVLKALKNLFKFKNVQQSLLVLLGLLGTGIGAYGGMPQPPKLFVDLTQQYEILQWVLVYVLIWQGAGGYDEMLSVIGTIILYILYKIVERLGENEQVYRILGLKKEKKE